MYRSTLLLLLTASFASAQDISFKKLQLSDKFYSEGANFGDINGDGKMDFVAGPYWCEGPDFQKKHEYYPAEVIDPLKYSANFLAFTDDFNKDDKLDILIIGFPGVDTSWFENPGSAEGPWKKHLAFPVTDNESPTYQDIVGDGKRELVFNTGGKLGWAEPDASDATKPWTFHAISPQGSYQRFTHGLGVGDVNGDGKMDLLEAGGWWEQPSSLKDDPIWKKHDFKFAEAGAQMYAYDVDGDGDADVITSWHAHQYGLFWYEQVKKDGEIDFVKHRILSENADQKKDGVQFSQLHAVDLVDIDGDGLKDIVTGKRHWAHGDKGDPEPNGPAYLYWFKLTRGKDGVKYIANKIDDASGVGTQVVAGDINGDGKPDIVVGNKSGQFIFIQEKK